MEVFPLACNVPRQPARPSSGAAGGVVSGFPLEDKVVSSGGAVTQLPLPNPVRQREKCRGPMSVSL